MVEQTSGKMERQEIFALPFPSPEILLLRWLKGERGGRGGGGIRLCVNKLEIEDF